MPFVLANNSIVLLSSRTRPCHARDVVDASDTVGSSLSLCWRSLEDMANSRQVCPMGRKGALRDRWDVGVMSFVSSDRQGVHCLLCRLKHNIRANRATLSVRRTYVCRPFSGRKGASCRIAVVTGKTSLCIFLW